MNGKRARVSIVALIWQETRWLEQVWVLEDATDGLACSALVKIKRLERGQGKRVVVREIHGTCLEAQSSMVRSLAELEDVVRIELCLPKTCSRASPSRWRTG
jgi:hypothetical protein